MALLLSKKFQTLLIGCIALFLEQYLDMPQDLTVATLTLFLTAIVGFAVQDWAKARDSLSQVQWDTVIHMILSRIDVDEKTRKHLKESLNSMQLDSLPRLPNITKSIASTDE